MKRLDLSRAFGEIVLIVVGILDRVGSPLPPEDEWTPIDEVSLEGMRGSQPGRSCTTGSA